MSWKSIYEKWKNFKEMDAKVKGNLQAIKNEEELEDSFYKNLEFGTAGMRGLLGAGTNRMNIYTVRKAALGLGRYIVENGDEARLRGVVIAYDSRHMSPEFALETASTLEIGRASCRERVWMTGREDAVGEKGKGGE